MVTTERLLAPYAILTCSLMRFGIAWASDSACCQLLKLVWPSDCYPLLLFCVRVNTISRGDLDSMKCDSSMALEATQGHRGSSGDLSPAGKVVETREGLEE